MRPLQKVEHNAKIASRRFSKSILCSIIEGLGIIAFMKQNLLIPTGMIVNDEFAYSTSHNRLFVVPLSNKEEFDILVANAGLSLSTTKDQMGNSTPGTTKEEGIQDQISAANRKEPLLKFLKQTMLMVAINKQDIPKDLPQVLKICNVLVESIDTSQAIAATLVPKSVAHENNSKQWNKK